MMTRAAFLLMGFLLVSWNTTAMEWKRMMIGTELVVRVEIVTSSREQTMGLGNRDSLPDGNGMLFPYRSPGERVFWMKRMRFPIDILWIRNGQIVHIEHQVPPPTPMTTDRYLKRYGMGVSADMVLELPAGYCRRHAIIPGQSTRLIQ